MPSESKYITINGSYHTCAGCGVDEGQEHRSSCTGGDHKIIVPRFQFSFDPEEPDKRCYVNIDGRIDIKIISTEDGLVIDVYKDGAVESFASLWANKDDLEPESELCGCGRPWDDCASQHGSSVCMDRDVYEKRGEPESKDDNVSGG